VIDVVEAPLAALRAALENGETTSVELVRAYLARIDAYDAPETATRLNAVVVRNPDALAEAAASDARRRRGELRGPLDGIPYTAKDSYLVRASPSSWRRGTRSRSTGCGAPGRSASD
jgi:amidase